MPAALFQLEMVLRRKMHLPRLDLTLRFLQTILALQYPFPTHPQLLTLYGFR